MEIYGEMYETAGVGLAGATTSGSGNPWLRRLEEDMLVEFHKLQEARRMRLRLLRIWRPDTMKWRKGGPPPETWSTILKRRAWNEMGMGPDTLDYWTELEERYKERLISLFEDHPLHDDLSEVRGLGPYLGAALIAVAGDPARAPTVTRFWAGMGLGLVNGQAPSKERGVQGIPCPPYVSTVGEQIRQNLLKLNPTFQRLYRRAKEEYLSRGWKRIRAHKAGLRNAQKVFYGCVWERWRRAHRLEAPPAYVFAYLGHTDKLTLDDFKES